MKLADIKDNQMIPTSIDGVFIRDLPLARLEEMGKLEESDDPTAPLLWLFNNLIVGEDGEPFEDARTADDLHNNVGMVTARQITDAALEALNPQGKQ